MHSKAVYFIPTSWWEKKEKDTIKREKKKNFREANENN